MRKLYVIRDVLAGYGIVSPSIIDMPTDDYAKRVVKGACAKGQKPNLLNTEPQDKELWCVGVFDEKTGVITPCQPYLIARAIDFINSEEIVDETNQSFADAKGN